MDTVEREIILLTFTLTLLPPPIHLANIVAPPIHNHHTTVARAHLLHPFHDSRPPQRRNTSPPPLSRFLPFHQPPITILANFLQRSRMRLNHRFCCVYCCNNHMCVYCCCLLGLLLKLVSFLLCVFLQQSCVCTIAPDLVCCMNWFRFCCVYCCNSHVCLRISQLYRSARGPTDQVK